MVARRGQRELPVFGRRMLEGRTRLNMPQDRLGVLIGLDESSSSARISRYENGVHEPPFSTAQRIAEALSLPTAFLYCEDDLIAQILLAVYALDRSQQTSLLDKLQSEGS